MYARILQGLASPKLPFADVRTITKEMHDAFTEAGYVQKPAAGKDAPDDAVFKDAASDGLVVYERSDNLELMSYIAGDELLRVYGMVPPVQKEDEVTGVLDLGSLLGANRIKTHPARVAKREVIVKDRSSTVPDHNLVGLGFGGSSVRKPCN